MSREQIERLRMTIRVKGFTQKGFAEEIGMNFATMYRKMEGISDFTRTEIITISEKLGLDAKTRDEIFFSPEFA